jgi:hypothetical protein
VYISGGESEAEVLGVGRYRPSVVKPALRGWEVEMQRRIRKEK